MDFKIDELSETGFILQKTENHWFQHFPLKTVRVSLQWPHFQKTAQNNGWETLAVKWVKIAPALSYGHSANTLWKFLQFCLYKNEGRHAMAPKEILLNFQM